MSTLAIRDLSKRYDGSAPVLDRLSLEAGDGEMLFLLGASGSGKSTLLRILAGLLPADSGQILLDGEEISRRPPEERRMAMVFQNYALWPHLDAAANVAFGLEAQGLARKPARRQAEEMLELVGLSGLAARMPGQLSGGQQQRVALARALAVSPRVLLLDEPLSNLDAGLRDQMRAELRRLCRERRQTAVYVTHDQKEAMAMADRIAILDRGQVRQAGPPRELYRRPNSRFVAEFLGDANVLEGRIAGAAGDGRFQIETPLGLWTGLADQRLETGAPALAIFRPEHLRLGDPDPENGADATLLHGEFLGASEEWRLQAGGQLLKAREFHAPPRQPGSAVRIRVPVPELRLLPL